MAFSPELQAELDRRFEIWLGKRLALPELMTRKMRYLAIHGTEKEFKKECHIAFLAEELEQAAIRSGEYVSLPEIKADGTIEFLWEKRKA